MAQLAKNHDTVRHAAWLGVCTTVALGLEIFLKIKIQIKKREDKKEQKAGNKGNFNVDDKQGRAEYIWFCSMMELTIFFVEDATTLFVWWQTGLYRDTADGASGLSKANLYITVASAVLAVIGLVYGVFRFIREEGDGCDSGAMFFGIPAAVICAGMIFWAWFALRIILQGGSRGCVDKCQLTLAGVEEEAEMGLLGAAGVARRDDATNDAMFTALAALLGRSTEFSAENKELLTDLSQLQCSFLPPGVACELPASALGPTFNETAFGAAYADDTHLNNMVIAVYAIGWILAVLCTMFTIMVVVFE